MTRADLRPDQPLLIGKLALVGDGLQLAGPRLEVDAWCPFCKTGHRHSWPSEPIHHADVVARTASCVAGPWVGKTYFVGLDGRYQAANARVMDSWRYAVEDHRKRYGVARRA